MQEVDSRLVDRRQRTLLNQPKMTPVARRIVCTTTDTLFPAVSRVALWHPVDISACNQRLHHASIHTSCTWCAGAPAANGVTEVLPWRDLVAAGWGKTAPLHGVLAVTAQVWSLINRRAQNYSSVHQLIPDCSDVASRFRCWVRGWACAAVGDERNIRIWREKSRKSGFDKVERIYKQTLWLALAYSTPSIKINVISMVRIRSSPAARLKAVM